MSISGLGCRVTGFSAALVIFSEAFDCLRVSGLRFKFRVLGLCSGSRFRGFLEGCDSVRQV